MEQVDIFDFKNIDKAPETTKPHDIQEVIKVFFDESSIDEPYQAVAIDIKNNTIYVDPIMNIDGFEARGGSVQISDAEKVIDILTKYEVQSWKSDYTLQDSTTYEDGFSWKLWLQYEDGTVEKHRGQGTGSEILPNNFDDFAAELYQFVEERLQKVE